MRLSYSQVRQYLECPRLYEWHYIRKKPVVVDGRLIAGGVYHHGLEYALKRKMQHELIRADEIKDVMSDRWDTEVRCDVIEDDRGSGALEVKEVNWKDDKPGELKAVVLSLGKLYLETMVPTMEPVAVEKKLEGMIGGIPFLGYADVVLPGPGVIDHKFTTRRMDQGTANKDMQITTYACLLDRPIWGGFHQALDQKKQDINVVLTQRGRGDMEWFSRLVEKVAKGIQTGIFPPNPLTWKCAEDNCAYWIECRVLMEE